MRDSRMRFVAIVCVNLLALSVLGFYGVLSAAPSDKNRQPFQNSVEQRREMIATLKEIRSLMKEQNELLREQLAKKNANGKP